MKIIMVYVSESDDFLPGASIEKVRDELKLSAIVEGVSLIAVLPYAELEAILEGGQG